MTAPVGGDPAAYKDAIFSLRTSSSAGRRRPASWSPDVNSSPTGCPTCLEVARSPMSTRTSTSSSPTRPIGRRAARRRSSSRSVPAWSSSSGNRGDRGDSRARGALPRRAVDAWRGEPGIEILGNLERERLSIVSFVKGHDSPYLHHNYVVALLNDLFGIQSRGGCSCRPLWSPAARHRRRALPRVRAGDHRWLRGIKPGWVRVNFNSLPLRHRRRLRHRGRADGRS